MIGVRLIAIRKFSVHKTQVQICYALLSLLFLVMMKRKAHIGHGPTDGSYALRKHSHIPAIIKLINYQKMPTSKQTQLKAKEGCTLSLLSESQDTSIKNNTLICVYFPEFVGSVCHMLISTISICMQHSVDYTDSTTLKASRQEN